jgi:outer membrane protein
MLRGARFLLAVAGLALPANLSGQEPAGIPAPRSLTLADAVATARANNPLLRQTANDLGGTAWGVRNAYASFLPTLSVSGGIGYQGPGSNVFVTSRFEQESATIGSSYNVGLSLFLSGRTFMQPGLAKAQHRAAEAAVTGAEVNLESLVRQQYLAVLQAEAQVDLAELQVTRNDEFLRLAQARFEVGQNTLLDVRQAEVAKGQSDVALLQARQTVTVEKLRLYQIMGIPAPTDPSVVTLADTFPVVQPTWELSELLLEADRTNPDLISLRAGASAARAGERAAKSEWLPSLSLSAGWSGFTQQFTDANPSVDNAIGAARSDADAAVLQCDFANDNWLNTGITPLDCSQFALTTANEDAIRDGILQANDAFPFDFTRQPFSARVSVSLPIFTQFSRPLRIAEASAFADDASEAVRGRELQVRTDVSQAYYALEAAYEAIGIQEYSRVAADEQLRLATERYRVGSGTFFELLDAQLAAQGAEADYINAIYAYHQAIATLENAVGRPLR